MPPMQSAALLPSGMGARQFTCLHAIKFRHALESCVRYFQGSVPLFQFHSLYLPQWTTSCRHYMHCISNRKLSYPIRSLDQLSAVLSLVGGGSWTDNLWTFCSYSRSLLEPLDPTASARLNPVAARTRRVFLLLCVSLSAANGCADAHAWR